MELKKVLAREYVTFFAPMRKEYYKSDVSFDDPLNSLSGIDAYENNVNMLAGRTALGNFLFEDAGIDLHSVKGGDISDTGEIGEITTRWTLRFTMKALPWTPTARFSGISVYKVRTNKDKNDLGLEITAQQDYWDSINLLTGNRYQAVDRLEGLKDLWNQVGPGGFQAAAAAPELPYTLLRRGKDYEVRRYPSFVSLMLPSYDRRDEGFEVLGSFSRTQCEDPLGPAILRVDGERKSMEWPLTFGFPDKKKEDAPVPVLATSKLEEYASRLKLRENPSRVVAVREFTDASMEPVVRKNDRLLRESLRRDGLKAEKGFTLQFAQYDAIFSMGTRRGEVWIPLDDDKDSNGHPW
eukprot:CAMPEP_0194139240 /NCGR_PEP_ID=MMETSP0152-20130528/8937_1 /TAXON_ID=1049557 /ORGANISM="Thalassiothrix antarctica, Strain L6-D1" /LENGTH=351 /DNA_ID=CAMNT_0038837019 /DNA_START=392 /DNA_END=1447 /DNA_ORIENTATION=-